jgi:hypothetical protein
VGLLNHTRVDPVPAHGHPHFQLAERSSAMPVQEVNCLDFHGQKQSEIPCRILSKLIAGRLEVPF